MPTPVQLDAPTRDVVWAYIPLDKVLFVSSDQGNRWEVRNLPPQPDSVTNITFVDATEGWALASIGGTGTCATEQVRIWHTVDGADTWQPVDATGISDAQCKLNLLFADRTHAFMASEEENLLPRIYRSTDGGHTWSWTALSDPAGFQSVPDGFAFAAGVVKSFGNTLLVSASGNGFLSGVAGSWVYRSTDGGVHWSEPVPLPTSPGAGQVAFMSATRWLILQGSSGAAIQSTDAGVTWNSFTSDYSDAAPVASSFVFADTQVGYGTVRGTFHRTTDGGHHWVTPATPW